MSAPAITSIDVAAALEARGYHRCARPVGSLADSAWQRCVVERGDRREYVEVFEYAPAGSLPETGYEIGATFFRFAGDESWASVRIYNLDAPRLLARLDALERVIARARTALQEVR